MADGPSSGHRTSTATGRPDVPWRTILATLAVVVAAYVGFLALRELSRVIAWLVVAGFFAIVLTPAVDAVERRLHLRRALATSIVFVLGLVLIVGILYSFIRPVVDQVSKFVEDLPEQVEEAREGRGPLGDIVERYDLDETLEENEERIQESLRSAGTPALGVVRGVFNGLLSFVTILVLTFLMLLRGPELCRGALGLVPERHRERVRVVAADGARAVSGYMFGNLVISVVAGVSTLVFLLVAGVPYAGVIAVWVAFADLIPLVGATLGAIPTILVAFLHSTPAGIAAIVFYVVYQQFENHVLQVTVMSRTVDVNPLTVLVSVLAGIELFGFLGALLAIPVAGVIQVVVRNLYDERRGRLKDEPTVGPNEVPVSEVMAARDAEADALTTGAQPAPR
ncbi:MAG: AI-2E family transporter [Acidimicrobiia bacterium]|nr:AI-2E family transporter [Acidimicrobiia bacterium]